MSGADAEEGRPGGVDGVGREPIVAVEGIAKRFGERAALRGVSFELRAGELVALIGANGAGKTTLLSILAGVRSASGGSVRRARGVAAGAGVAAIGWVPQQSAVYTKLTVAENLRLFARLERVPDPQAVVGAMLEQTDLRERADEQVGRLSGGNRQRVNIALGLLSQPALLLLDEPSAALDPRQRGRLWQFVHGLTRQGTSVMFSTHNVAEAHRYAGRVLVLDAGELLFDGPPRELVPEGSHDGDGIGFEEALVAFLQERGR